MLEDRLLILRLKCGSAEALGQVYEKYRKYLLKIAVALLHDSDAAEDVVHDVFLRFARARQDIGLTGSLKSYLRVSVVHCVRNSIRHQRVRNCTELNENGTIDVTSPTADQWVVLNEESMRVNDALSQIPFEQREIVVLHLCGGMTFRQIAELQAESIKTIQSRYRYGLEKLRLLLDES